MRKKSTLSCFSTKEFLEEDEPDYIPEEVNVVSSEKKFKSLDQQTKNEKETKPSIKEPPELELKPLPNYLKYVYFEFLYFALFILCSFV